MSFVLHVFFAPKPLASVREGAACVSAQARAIPTGELLGRFQVWHGALVTACPDLSEDDSDGDRADNAWPQGLPARFDTSVYSFRPNVGLLDQGLMGLIAEAAALTGLHVLDMQNGMLYRPDRNVVSMKGRMHAPPKAVVPVATQAARIKEAEVREVLATLRPMLDERLIPFGFRRQATGALTRQVGEVEQEIETSSSFGHGELAMKVGYRLFAPRVTAVWAPVVQAEFTQYLAIYAHLGRFAGGRVDSFEFGPLDLYGRGAGEFGKIGRAVIREQAARWFNALGSHLIETALPVLDEVGSTTDLARIVLSESNYNRLLGGRMSGLLPELFGILVLVHAFKKPEAATWHAAIAKFGDSRADYSFAGWPNGKPLIDRVIAYLESPAFDPRVVA